MLGVLGLIDITVVANLWTPAVTGGYATFVSKLNLDGHADWLDWLSHVDPGTIKVKLAALLIGISSVHLLQAFVDVANENPDHIKWKIFIYMSFLGSAILLALTDKIIRIRNTEWGIRMNTACILFDGPVHALFPVQTSFERFPLFIRGIIVGMPVAFIFQAAATVIGKSTHNSALGRSKR